MKAVNSFLQSGLIESYVLGLTTNEEMLEVEAMAAMYPEVELALDQFCDQLELQGKLNAKTPPTYVKTLLMATIDYTERLQSGELMAFPPALNEQSKIIDYAQWLQRPDMQPPAYYEDVYAKIIGATPQQTTAIAWLKTMAPDEVHNNEIEKFLIVEGTCDITVGENVYQLVPGDFFAIPLFKNHKVVVTSNIPCKVILQRSAA